MKMLKALAPLVMWLGATAAHAATVEINQTLNLARPVATFGDFDVFGAPFNYNDVVAVNQGDTLIATVTFLGLDPRPQELTLNDVSVLFPYFQQWSTFGNSSFSQASDVVATGKLELLDAEGNVIFTSASLTSAEGVHHFINGVLFDDHAGQYFDANSLAGLAPSITFAGYRYTATLDAYETPRPYPISYVQEPRLYVMADSYSTNVTAVPEPASWAMMILGFGLIGALARGQRRSVTA